MRASELPTQMTHLVAPAWPLTILVTTPAVLFASGALGRIGLIGAPVDAVLVLQVLLHAGFGCVLVAVQWAAGAGVVNWLNPQPRSLSELMLLGFPWTLVVVFASSVIALATPLGWVIALAGILACLSSFALRPPKPGQFSHLARIYMALLPSGIALGCWMGLLWHGPTFLLPGEIPGDAAWYASSMYSLQDNPFQWVNYGNEGEVLPPVNMIVCMLGAAFMKFIPLDPFLFLTASGPAIYVVGLGLALFSYISVVHERITLLNSVLIGLAAIVSIWLPIWVVTSPPVIFALPLTISIWYFATRCSDFGTISWNFSAALVGSGLSKVTTFLTLGPLAVAPVLQHGSTALKDIRQRSPIVQISAVLIAAAALSYCSLMVARYLPVMITEGGGIKPETLEHYQYGLQYLDRKHAALAALPYILRDGATILLAFVAVRMLAWPLATAIVMGLIGALIFPWAMRINLDCAIIVLALAGVERPQLLKKLKWLALAALVCCLPAVAQTEFGGHPSSLVWFLCMGAMTYVVLGFTNTAAASPIFTQRSAQLAAGCFSFLLLTGLFAVARQQVYFDNPRDYITIWPNARDIWTTVRNRTPRGALLFTDQTGRGPGDPLDLNASWNSYATTAQRQIFIAGWYQSPELRQFSGRLKSRLDLNAKILDGRMRPQDVIYRRGPYTDFYAVVERSRAMPSQWHKIYENSSFTLYRYTL